MPAILRIENLSKVYRLGELDRNVFFRDFKRKLTGDFSEVDEADPSLFWALRDINLEIQEGEVVGLLGRNGAGKSTLLKVLAQITAPTRGWVGLRGRVASLLEVGTGFHHEMTGRENIFLNGTILGMSRREVQGKFDEIVAFSGVEKFLDSPVKHYSVGMGVRLAFAVAAHLEPEILLVDEVLAVGDAAFQAKCLGKIGEVSRSGRTVILVSHSNASIEALCTRGVLLERGGLVYDGTALGAIEASATKRAALATRLEGRADRRGTGEVRLVGVRLRQPTGAVMAAARSGQPVEIVLDYERAPEANFSRLSVQIMVSNHLGTPIFSQANWLSGTLFGDLPARGSLVCQLPRLPIVPAHYQIAYRLDSEVPPSGHLLDSLEDAAELIVEGGDFFGMGRVPGPREGAALVEGSWRVEKASE